MKMLLVLLSFVVLALGTVHAETVYTWNTYANELNIPGAAFKLATSSSITKDTYFSNKQLSCTTCTGVTFIVDAMADAVDAIGTPYSIYPAQAILYWYAPAFEKDEVWSDNFYYEPGAFTTNGVYDVNFGNNHATLSVTGDADPRPSEAPEPSSIFLLGTGMLGLVETIRRKLRT